MDIVGENRAFGYTIYKEPRDAPGYYVVRGWDIESGDVVLHEDAIAVPLSDIALAVIRESLLEGGLVCLGREDGDDPQILESWV
jgi:hypothetical protein